MMPTTKTNETVTVFDAMYTPSPKGEQVGWVGLYKESDKRGFFMNPSKFFADFMFEGGDFVWLRGLYFDDNQYYIAV
jgi:hypothetical protein